MLVQAAQEKRLIVFKHSSTTLFHPLIRTRSPTTLLSPPFFRLLKVVRPVGCPSAQTWSTVSLRGGENCKLDFNTKRIQRFRILFG